LASAVEPAGCAILMAHFLAYTLDDACPTHSSDEQERTEKACADLYMTYMQPSPMETALQRDAVDLRELAHAAYLKAGLGDLSSAYTSLDASRPWLCYWMLHGLEILGQEIPAAFASAVVSFLYRCQDLEGGGFCGGPRPGQVAHLAPTYAAINALVTIGTEAAYACIDRPALRRFLIRMKAADGSFRMHDDGEADVRGSYCALSVATLTDVLDDQVSSGAAGWLCMCQTYEGGIGATPGEEAHGGYTFCGLAALLLVGGASGLRLPQLAYWLTQRQMQTEGGFQGRTNKLVDGCYSFWQGGSFPLLQAALTATGMMAESDAWLINSTALLDYLMVCAQCGHGGLRDKPGKGRDYYHTCYGLSGMAVAAAAIPRPDVPTRWISSVRMLNPVFNVSARKAESARIRFQGSRA